MSEIKINVGGSIEGGTVQGGNGGSVDIVVQGPMSGLHVSAGRVIVNGREVASGFLDAPAPTPLSPFTLKLLDAEMLAQTLALSARSVNQRMREARATSTQAPDPEVRRILADLQPKVSNCVELVAQLQAELDQLLKP
jgi:hypothetical protein